MITLLDTLGPAIWRASWQAAALALLVVLLLRCCGERLSPRWRFLLWGVVLARLLIVATPVSPWSVFNLARWSPEASLRPIAERTTDPNFTPVTHRSDSTAIPNETNTESPRVAGPAPEFFKAQVSAPAKIPTVPSGTTLESTPSNAGLLDAVVITRVLASIWLAGCLLLG